MMLDNPRVAAIFPPAYYLAMSKLSVRQRILEAMAEQGISKAELHRRSGVPYHAIDKFLKREGATTSAENAHAMLSALGLSADPEEGFDELRAIFSQLPEDKQRFALAAIRGLLDEEDR